MHRFVKNVMVVSVTFSAMCHGLCAQSTDPKSAVAELARTFVALWNAHEMEGLGAIVTEDVDWVNVDGYRGTGRSAIVEGHMRVHQSKFKDSVMTINAVNVALIRDDVAIAHVSWGLVGDRNNDGSPRQPRDGLFTWIAVKDDGVWRIRASHNSNKSEIK